MSEGSIIRRCTTCSVAGTRKGDRWVCPNHPEKHKGKLRWSALIDLPPTVTENGRLRRRQTRRTFTTREEADRWLASVKVDTAKGDYVPADRITFAEYVEAEWFPHITHDVLPRSGKPRRPTTVRSYQDLMTAYVLPVLGPVKLQTITRGQLEGLYRDLLDTGGRDGTGLSNRTVSCVAAVVSMALDYAEDQQLVRRSVAAKASVPGRDSDGSEGADLQCWNESQLETFWSHIGTDHELFPLFYAYAWTGARRGELLALRWADLDLSRATMRIRRNRVSVNYAVSEQPPKTRRGHREIPFLNSTLATVLKTWKERQVPSIDGYVFTDPLGRPHHPERISKVFADLVAGTDLPPIPLHGLRHTFATIALARGVEPYKVSRILGHSGIQVTLDIYHDYIPSQDEQLVGMISDRISLGGV